MVLAWVPGDGVSICELYAENVATCRATRSRGKCCEGIL